MTRTSETWISAPHVVPISRNIFLPLIFILHITQSEIRIFAPHLTLMLCQFSCLEGTCQHNSKLPCVSKLLMFARNWWSNCDDLGNLGIGKWKTSWSKISLQRGLRSYFIRLFWNYKMYNWQAHTLSLLEALESHHSRNPISPINSFNDESVSTTFPPGPKEQKIQGPKCPHKRRPTLVQTRKLSFRTLLVWLGL